MTFQQPLVLLGLLAVPLLAALVVWWRRRRPPAGVAFPSLDVVAAADPGPRRRRHLPLILSLLAVAAFVVALARPQGYRDEPRERATIMLVVDVSGSMAATDVEPYRLRAAQDAALRFADEVPRQYQVGLVSFSTQANLLVPPTTDRQALREAIEGLSAFGDTAVGDAILTALDGIRSAQGGVEEGRPLEAARIVLLTDGANRRGSSPTEAARQAKEAGVPIYTVALGTPEGVLNDSFRTPVPPDPEGLAEIADITGGTAYESRDADSVREVYEHLGSFVGTERVRSEITGWPAGIGAALLVLAGVAAWRFGPRLS
ncbi:MAG: VWA domain-containing protein [Thermoleophilia bacterium]